MSYTEVGITSIHAVGVYLKKRIFTLIYKFLILISINIM